MASALASSDIPVRYNATLDVTAPPRSAVPASTTTARVIVVGGGVIGVSCAYALVRAGVDVILLERDGIGQGASYGNAGVIACGHPPMNRPGRVTGALKTMLDPTTPLFIAPRWDPALVRWLWRFSTNCTAERLESNMQTLGPLGHASFEQFNRLVDEESLACGYRADGYFEACRTEAGLDASHRDTALMRDKGFATEELSGAELRARVPALAEGTLGGAHFPEAATCDPHRFVLELAERVRRRGGSVRPGQPVDAIATGSGGVVGVRTRAGDLIEADTLVLATGAYGLELTRSLGCDLPIQPGKGYHRDLAVGDGSAPSLNAACVLAETSVFCTPMAGALRLAGTMEFSGLNHRMRRPRLEQLTTAAGRYMQGIGTTDVRSEWCGLRPCTADGLPVVGAVPGHDRIFVATGHAMSGLTLGPVTGSLIADLVVFRTPPIDIAALDAGRFA